MRLIIDMPETEDLTPRVMARLAKAVNANLELTGHPFTIKVEEVDPEDLDDTLDLIADPTFGGINLVTGALAFR